MENPVLQSLQKMVDDATTMHTRDAVRFAELDDATCQLCGAVGNDKRSLVISYFYAIHEVVPEAISLHNVDGLLHDRGYYLRTCKSCRGRFLQMMEGWRAQCIARRGLPKDHDGYLDEE